MRFIRFYEYIDPYEGFIGAIIVYCFAVMRLPRDKTRFLVFWCKKKRGTKSSTFCALICQFFECLRECTCEEFVNESFLIIEKLKFMAKNKSLPGRIDEDS